MNRILDKFAPVLLLAVIALSFLVGVLWQKVENLSKGTTTTAAVQPTQQQVQPTVTVTLDQIKGLFKKDLIKFGDENKKLLLVEIADPSCPFCHVAAGKNPELNKQMGAQFILASDGGAYVAPVPEMKKLVEQGKASFVWIYFPGHGNGELATKTLYCAHEKGKFWEAHDLLMTNKAYTFINDTVKNDKTKSGEMAEFLKDAVDPGFIKSCLDSGKYDERLANDNTVARELGVQGTPGFFINDKTFAGAYSYKDMEATVTSALK